MGKRRRRNEQIFFCPRKEFPLRSQGVYSHCEASELTKTTYLSILSTSSLDWKCNPRTCNAGPIAPIVNNEARGQFKSMCDSHTLQTSMGKRGRRSEQHFFCPRKEFPLRSQGVLSHCEASELTKTTYFSILGTSSLD